MAEQGLGSNQSQTVAVVVQFSCLGNKAIFLHICNRGLAILDSRRTRENSLREKDF